MKPDQERRWIRRDNSCYGNSSSQRDCNTWLQEGKYEQANDMDCCPLHYLCTATGSPRGICLPTKESLENMDFLRDTRAPIGNPALFSSTRSRETLKQPREAFTDPFVSRYEPQQGGWVWEPVTKEQLQELHRMVLNFTDMKQRLSV